MCTVEVGNVEHLPRREKAQTSGLLARAAFPFGGCTCGVRSMGLKRGEVPSPTL